MMKIFKIFLATSFLGTMSWGEQKVAPQQPSQKKNSKKETKDSPTTLAFVGKHLITLKDLEDRIHLILVTSHSPLTAENKNAIREQVLKNMIEELVQISVAEKYKCLAKDREIVDTLTNMAKENNLKLEQMQEALVKQGVSIESFKSRIKAQLSWNNFVRGAYAHTIHISDNDIAEYFQRMKADADKEQFEVYEIFLRSDGKDSESVKSQANNLVAKVKSGASFRDLARQFSQSPSAARGGYLGWVNGTREGNQTFTRLDVGQVSAPVQTGSGYYVYYLSDKKLPGQSQQSQQLISYKQIVIPVTKGFTAEEDPYLKAHLDALMQAENLAHFERIVKERELKTAIIKDRPLQQIPAEHQEFFKALPINKASQPAMTPEGLVIVVVTGKRTAEPPKPPTKEDAKDIIENERLAKISTREFSKYLTSVFMKLTNPKEFPNIPYGVTQPSMDQKA